VEHANRIFVFAVLFVPAACHRGEEPTMTESTQGRRTAISRDPVGVDPIGNDPLDFSDAPPKQGEGPNRTILGWTATATGVFTAAVVLGVIMVIVIVWLATRS
jgi:hypothetical protein